MYTEDSISIIVTDSYVAFKPQEQERVELKMYPYNC